MSDLQEDRSVRDGENFKQNHFLSLEGPRIAVHLYVDDFEICNPLGTSQRKHKLCSVYWVLSNLPLRSSSRLTLIYLALVCKSDHLKVYGFEKLFEQHGVFISQLGQFIKGS